MALIESRELLLELLNAVVEEPGHDPRPDGEEEEKEPVRGGSIPSDLPGPVPAPDGMLWLAGHAADLYFRCRRRLQIEGEDGELEHLSPQAIEQILWRLTCEVWITRTALDALGRSAKVDAFIEAHRHPQEEWEVLWEIEDLTIKGTIDIAGVEFFPFVGAASDRWMRPEGHVLRPLFDEKLIGKAFARVVVRAGTKQKALERSRSTIDDAIGILRVALLKAIGVHRLQRLQRIGTSYYAARLSDTESRLVGAERGFEPHPLGIEGELLDLLRSRVAEFNTAFDERHPAELREPLFRSLIWIGSSVSRESADDKVVDLCTALECLFLDADDRGGKAAAIAARYRLVGIALGEASFVSPPELYGLYQMRNNILHGSSRRECGQAEHGILEIIAQDAFDLIRTLIEQQPQIRSMRDLYAHIQTDSALSRIQAYLGRQPEGTQGKQQMEELLKSWMKTARSSRGEA